MPTSPTLPAAPDVALKFPDNPLYGTRCSSWIALFPLPSGALPAPEYANRRRGCVDEHVVLCRSQQLDHPIVTQLPPTCFFERTRARPITRIHVHENDLRLPGQDVLGIHLDVDALLLRDGMGDVGVVQTERVEGGPVRVVRHASRPRQCDQVARSSCAAQPERD